MAEAVERSREEDEEMTKITDEFLEVFKTDACALS